MRRFPFHPFLFGAFYVLYLLAYHFSVQLVPVREALWPLIFCLAGVAFVLAVLTAVLGDLRRAGLLSFLLILLFFSFTGVQESLRGIGGVAGQLSRPAALGAVWLGMFGMGTYLIVRVDSDLKAVNFGFNIGTAVLSALQVILISLALATTPSLEATSSTLGHEEALEPHRVPEPFPDVYYIVLDGYGSGETLERVYGYDNSDFLDHLVQRGFFVMDSSAANYSQTGLSLASSLNFTYLDDLVSAMGTESLDRRPLTLAIWQNRARVFLSRLDYEVVYFSSGYSTTDGGVGADRYLKPSGVLSEFHNLVLSATPLALVTNQLRWFNQYEFHRKRILFTLEELQRVGREKPVFVFAHLICPHPPFIFAPDGRPVQPDRLFKFSDGDHFQGSRAEYLEGYRGQLRYLNDRLLDLVDALLAGSETAPVIILQGDHGPGSGLDHENPAASDIRERMTILNALHVAGVRAQLYESMTPVNTFRVLFNAYFDTGLELLEDRSYFARWSRPYSLVEVTGSLSQEPGPDNR